MRISAKGRYGLAAMLTILENQCEQAYVPVNLIADRLGLSKIYLEQIFSLLKRGGLLISTKGSQGGYKLARAAEDINVYEILTALEQALFEATDASFSEQAPALEKTLQEEVFGPLDAAVRERLERMTLHQLFEAFQYNAADGASYMYYI